MSIKISYKDLMIGAPAFGQVMQLELPIKVGVRLRRMAINVQRELDVVNLQIKELREKYIPKPTEPKEGEKRAKPATAIPEENVPAYNVEYEALGEVEIEIPLEPIRAEDLGIANIKPQLLFALKDFISD